MTSVLNFNSSSSSESAAQDKGTTSILSNAKNTPTFIIQPPSSTNTSNLLSKRFNNSNLGDLLLKKVKSQTANSSEVNSNDQSPITKGLKEVIYDTSDNQSIQEEGNSPAISSFDTVEKINLLMPQRSLSTPIFSNLHLNRGANQSSQKQILNALETLQKRLVEYQVLSLRDAILKAHLSQVPLIIPTLSSGEEKIVSPVQKIISNLQNDADDLDIYYGEVEYPLLHLAPKDTQVEVANKKAKAGTSNKVKGSKNKKLAKMSNCSSPSFEDDKQNDSLLESLTATRAGTQRSEPEMTINLRELSEQVAELIGQKNKKANKNSKNEESIKVKETVKKNQKKEKKQKGKKGTQEALLSPVLKGKRMTERKKNRWQAQEEDELRI
jgi:hypothetical protein